MTGTRGEEKQEDGFYMQKVKVKQTATVRRGDRTRETTEEDRGETKARQQKLQQYSGELSSRETRTRVSLTSLSCHTSAAAGRDSRTATTTTTPGS